jgi:hypothetical protein
MVLLLLRNFLIYLAFLLANQGLQSFSIRLLNSIKLAHLFFEFISALIRYIWCNWLIVLDLIQVLLFFPERISRSSYRIFLNIIRWRRLYAIEIGSETFRVVALLVLCAFIDIRTLLLITTIYFQELPRWWRTINFKLRVGFYLWGLISSASFVIVHYGFNIFMTHSY